MAVAVAPVAGSWAASRAGARVAAEEAVVAVVAAEEAVVVEGVAAAVAVVAPH